MYNSKYTKMYFSLIICIAYFSIAQSSSQDKPMILEGYEDKKEKYCGKGCKHYIM